MTNLVALVQCTALITAALLAWACIDTAIRCEISKFRQSKNNASAKLGQDLYGIETSFGESRVLRYTDTNDE